MDIREEVFAGRHYYVVPVVALVEGVVFGATSSSPEFVPSESFSDFPDTWNTRPVTVNHPHNGQTYVLAGSQDILRSYQIGFLFNTKASSDKLITEAWIDSAMALEKATSNDKIKLTLDRLRSGDTIDVSIGAIVTSIAGQGTYNGSKYDGVWQTIIPDHLAILPDSIGACSVDAGCGTFRAQELRIEHGSNSSNRTSTKSSLVHLHINHIVGGKSSNFYKKEGISTMSDENAAATGDKGQKQNSKQPAKSPESVRELLGLNISDKLRDEISTLLEVNATLQAERVESFTKLLSKAVGRDLSNEETSTIGKVINHMDNFGVCTLSELMSEIVERNSSNFAGATGGNQIDKTFVGNNVVEMEGRMPLPPSVFSKKGQ